MARNLFQGLGQSVAERSILRKKDDKYETWEEVANRVALGNISLLEKYNHEEYLNLQNHIANASILMSGRHLQHGDANQRDKNMEVFTNCSTSAASHLKFYLMLNGSGVGRCYDNVLMIANWNDSPEIICCLESTHPDFDDSTHITPKEASNIVKEHKHEYLEVLDSREGWGHALELWENLAYDNPNKVKYLVLDFSSIRPSGSPIKGMQSRPASGPAPTMLAFERANTACRNNWANWKVTMYIDHYFAECVRVGGARRAARMAVKYWKDEGIFEFIRIKEEGGLWTANNSVGVDAEFWEGVNTGDEQATKVFQAIIDSSYGTGEPGIINVDKLHSSKDFPETLKIGNAKYQVSEKSDKFFNDVLSICKNMPYHHIVNPCGEISLAVWGGFCVIADLAPYFCESLEEVLDSCKAATRALIRVNTMDSVFNQEVKRTNRIGVGLTGVFEFAWKFFKLGFKDLIDESKSLRFWKTIDDMGRTVEKEAKRYSLELGLNSPHTALTIKPAGTTSKLFGLTEGWHLASMDFYLRWVQFKKSDELVTKYKKLGYPVKDLKKYESTSIVGFPTSLEISSLGLGDKLILAGKATPEEQYKWLMLGEKYWLGNNMDNQISYTLKYNPKITTKEDFAEMLQKYQPFIKCCSVMPQSDDADLLNIYEYLPEEKITLEDYNMYKTLIQLSEDLSEDIGLEHVDCGAGGCPIDFKTVKE